MRKLCYSPEYKRKILAMKERLIKEYGKETQVLVQKKITTRLRHLCNYEESGVSLRNWYGIDTDYRYVYVEHNYVFYRFDDANIYIVNIYNEREDFMYQLFGICPHSEESEEYWGE